MGKALSLWVGARAAEHLQREGWHPELFDMLIGASGGPKWLILAALDRVLYRDLLRHRQRPLAMVASSIGSWRHACLSQPDPLAAIDRFESAYLGQSYSERPDTAEVARVATEVLTAAIGTTGPRSVAEHPVFHNHVVTARAVGVARGTRRAGIGFGMGAAALANALHRPWLAGSFRRVVFSRADAPLPGLLRGFATEQVALREDNVVPALKASGAIPLVIDPVHAITGAPPGPYWDGGIIDYHFEPQAQGSELLLYPHFTDTLTPGWFDKFLPWRAGRKPAAEGLVLLCPSREFIAGLPFGKIPDRRDFQRLEPTERQRYWRQCLDATEALADEFAALLAGGDPLAGAQPLPASIT